ncbi:MAG: DoxX family membrane protein [Alphaproteobacteria bacterium]
MSLAERISPLLGRLALAWFFLSDAYMRASDWSGTVALLNGKNIPVPEIVLFVALSAMVLGGLSLVLGLRTKAGAALLFAFTITSTVLLHDYWTLADAEARQADFQIFIRNVAIAGGLLLLLGIGPGSIAVDNAGRSRHSDR